MTLKTYPDRLCLSYQNNLVARHARSDDRHGDFEHPDHPKPLLEQRKRARDHQLFRRFLALASQAEVYDRALEQRRLNPHHHVRKIVALSDIYGQEDVARALADAIEYQAFASDYIANLLEQRARFTPEASPLYLTRRDDLLDIHLPRPDLSLYPDPTSTNSFLVGSASAGAGAVRRRSGRVVEGAGLGAARSRSRPDAEHPGKPTSEERTRDTRGFLDASSAR